MKMFKYVLLSEHKESSRKKDLFFMVFMAGISRKLLKILLRVTELISYDVTHLSQNTMQSFYRFWRSEGMVNRKKFKHLEKNMRNSRPQKQYNHIYLSTSNYICCQWLF